MHQKHRVSTFVAGGDHDEPQSSSENGGVDSPLSADDPRSATATAPSPIKGRRSIQKMVVSVPIADVEGSRSSSRGEAYPPSDSWAWRKYGQKPIKGSPYPRGYYRCSSSKGCPARKQVERSRVDPTMLVITYAAEHNHPVPTSKQHHPSSVTANASAAVIPTTPTSNASAAATVHAASPNLTAVETTSSASGATAASDFSNQKELPTCAAELGLGGDALMDFCWLSDVAIEAPSFVGPKWDDADVAMLPVCVTMREEDESLFADLEELPECSTVFRRERGISTCNMGPTAAPPLCGSTG